MLNTPMQPGEIARRDPAVTGDDRYEYSTYSVVTDRRSRRPLQIGVREKTYGPPFLMVGLDLNNIDSSELCA